MSGIYLLLASRPKDRLALQEFVAAIPREKHIWFHSVPEGYLDELMGTLPSEQTGNWIGPQRDIDQRAIVAGCDELIVVGWKNALYLMQLVEMFEAAGKPVQRVDL